MADEIKLKAPTVEQQVVVNINGEDKLKSFADTLDKISNNKNLQKYWKTQQDLINATADAYSNFQKKASKDNASELIKVTNALKAMSGTDLSHILPDFDKISKSMAEAQKVAGNIDSAFSVKGFKEAFDSFETLKAYGTDIQKLFSHFGVSSDIGELQQNVRLLEGEVEKLTRRLSNARNANEELRNEFENFKVGSGFADKLDELDRLKAEMQNIRDEATQTFNQFLDANKIDRYDWFSDDRFAEYFEKLENGTLTATDAIRRFKSEYSYLLEDSYKSNGDSFGLDQLQAFSTKLDSIFHQVEETSNKINDIISNGVIAKSVQNLSEDTALSDSQRSIFGNILQDKESLKSITSLFQKLIDETNQTKNTEVFNTEQFTKIESLFTSIESSLSSIKGVLVDVGDGEELSPLLKTITNVESGIDKLSSSVKGIGLNMNIDLGSDKEMEAKAEAKISNALQAYQRLFEHIKMSSAGGSIINTKFFDFDINQYDTTMSKLQAYRKFIENMRNEAKAMYGGQDVLFTDTDKKYWTQASSAMGQVTKTFNEMKAASDTNPLENIFGKTDLTEVLNQLSTIASKLDEISMSANRFADIFKDGLNVNASVEEIDKLTNRVKELESELEKIKTPTVATPQESNISLGDSSAIDTQNKLQEELKETQVQAEKTAQAILKVTGYRGTNGGDPVTSNKSGATFWDSKKNVAKMYGTDSSDKTLWSSELSFKNPLTIDANKQKFGDITYLGKGADEASKRILELTQRENELRESLKKSTQSGEEQVKMALELSSVCKEIAKISNDASNPYGTHNSDWFAEYAKNNGYDGVHFKNVLDTPDSYAKDGTEVSDVYVTFQREQLQNTTLLAKANRDLADSEREVALAELGVVKNASQDQIKDAFPDKDVSASVETATNSIKEENNVLEQNTQKVKENTQAKEQNANVNLNKYDKRLDSYNGKVDKYQATIDRFNDGGWTSKTYLEKVQAVRDAVKQYATLLDNIKTNQNGIASDEDIQNLDKYEKKIKDTIATVTNMSASEKGYSQLAGQKEIDKINKILRESSAMSSEAKAKIKAYKQELISGNPSASLEKIHGEIMKIVNAEELAGRAGRSFFDTLKNSRFHQIAAQMAGMFGIYDIINLGKEGFNVVRELNTALTEMRKVSNETVQSLKNYQATTFDTADAVGTTAKQIQNSTADWMRLGESMDQAAESAKDANVLLNVSEFEGIDEATESLVSMSQAYKDLDKMDIIDVLNNIGNNYSISTDGLATALKDSASALVTANNDLNEAVSLTTAGNAITQDPSKVGAGLRTISLRLVGTEAAKQELSDLGEETDGMITTVSKLRDTIMDATKAASADGKGFDILDSNGNYKSTYEIMQGLADLYDNIVKKDKELGTNNLNLLLETIAGKNRSNIAASILQNGDMLRSVYEDAQNSEGSAEKELNSYLDSIDGKMAQLENRAQEFWFKVIDSETIKNGIDLLSTLLKGVTDFVDKVGILRTAFIGLTGYLTAKNANKLGYASI